MARQGAQGQEKHTYLRLSVWLSKKGSFITSLEATSINGQINTETKRIKLSESTMKISINTICQKGRDYTLIKKPN